MTTKSALYKRLENSENVKDTIVPKSQQPTVDSIKKTGSKIAWGIRRFINIGKVKK